MDGECTIWYSAGMFEHVLEIPAPQATELRAALSKKLDVAVSHLLAGNGSVEIIDLVARAFLGPGDHAVISEHAFVRFREVGRESNAHFVAWFEPDNHIVRREAGFFVRAGWSALFDAEGVTAGDAAAVVEDDAVVVVENCG